MNKTKAQLQEELSNANSTIKRLQDINKNLEKKIIEGDRVEYTYLYTATDMTPEYVKSLLQKTTLIRTVTTRMPGRKVDIQVRLFDDKNKVEVRHVVYDDVKHKPEMTLAFFKKETRVEAKK